MADLFDPLKQIKFIGIQCMLAGKIQYGVLSDKKFEEK